MWTNCPLKVEIEDCIRKLENVHSKEKLQNQYIIIPTSQKIYFGLLQKKKKKTTLAVTTLLQNRSLIKIHIPFIVFGHVTRRKAHQIMK